MSAPRVDALADLAQHPADRLVHEVLAIVEQARREPKDGRGVAGLDERERREHGHAALPERVGCRELVEQRIVAPPRLAQELARRATRPSCRRGPSCSRGPTHRVEVRLVQGRRAASSRVRGRLATSNCRTITSSAASRCSCTGLVEQARDASRCGSPLESGATMRVSPARSRRRRRRPRRTGPGPVLKKRGRNRGVARRRRPRERLHRSAARSASAVTVGRPPWRDPCAALYRHAHGRGGRFRLAAPVNGPQGQGPFSSRLRAATGRRRPARSGRGVGVVAAARREDVVDRSVGALPFSSRMAASSCRGVC